MRILIADDDPKVLSALALLLDQEPDFDVGGIAKNAEELEEKLRAGKYDLILLDWELPGLTPEWSKGYLSGSEPRAVVVAMSGRTQARQTAEAAGVDAFVSKGDPPERLTDCLHDVLLRWRSRS